MKTMITNKAGKYLEKLLKGDPKSTLKIKIFLNEVLATAQNPLELPNCRKVVGALDNRWRWRVGQYRIIGVISNSDEIQILYILEIDKKDDNTYNKG
ncbi:hypothetical protein [Campylobacter sp.]|uniref:type II toxin-antitoxin system RelE family toxin n=2 Tax=Campylobacter sp. TaxID=205 RepID=UPI002A75575F|nr:hypothetical protein [Campylobacter sp.]MCI6565638.1 hypothetical protein [Campylobacter sp.]MDY3245879.1 hypothetical protein [Campylobacter sp.]